MHPIAQPRRRQLLQAAALGVAVLSTGCASVSTAARPRVVVVGGGWGGLGAVRGLLATAAADVTLVEPNEAFMSCPLSAHFIAGHQPATDFQRSYSRVDQLGARRVRERVLEIDRTSKMVVTATQRLPYDFLVLSPGVDYMEDGIQGYAEARAQLPVGFRAFEQMAVRQQVDEFLAKGGDFVISAPKPPYRCPPAPYERAFLIAEQMKQRGTKGKIILIDANPNPMPLAIAQPILKGMKGLYANQIEYLTDTSISAVDMGKRQLVTSSGNVPFAHANLILPMRAPALIRQAGLGERWANIRLPSFQSQVDDRIYVIGDSQGTPLPKSGHVAFGSGQRVAEAIAERIAGKSPVVSTGAVDLPLGICWANVTHKEAININVSGTVMAGEPPKLKFTVDAEANARSGAAAVSWGNGMWKAMLG
ncbi:MAG: FAD/NAD(P)-binding oxidoreductase [Hydrogenophaga sp.]|uniref:NAD(P)/FAD-dependent oxidoreductase n=1 Tax=Hydrogenophaga sp. TaxID=1904254 RepID=UPI00271AB7C6|nr:FAD/NAD(P)-binding oxidoreductase [Hydrogenophaga sp.]MDO9507603.1 FAD/NAD(P)-binding oxidoreductase [Hydrogenophaga sp.]MDP3202634.1 FAD/NAD(P)-binding oxidoreductase [Hydrogenophaga sp.]MDP3625915.1 FAD/NAD(P)-binding oxidoreductase [Hydrogenophaga sp.]